MSISIDTQNLAEYPGNIKRITVDQVQIVPTGFEGDEQYAVVISTSAYSDNVNNTKIQNLYILDLNVGWAKSSGLAGSAGKFMLSSSANTLRVKLDNTVSGTDSTGYYPVVLDFNASTPKSGEDIAADLEAKIRAISCVAADAGHQLSYKNSTVAFKESKFWISSGSFSGSYTNTYKSSVAVAPGLTNDCSAILGFNMPVTSESLASSAAMEALVTVTYASGTNTLAIGMGTGVVAGDCLAISNATHTDYFTALSVVDGTTITVPTFATNGYDGIKHTYTANVSKVQVLRTQDPDSKPQSYVSSIDDVLRFGVKSIINQIDYSV